MLLLRFTLVVASPPHAGCCFSASRWMLPLRFTLVVASPLHAGCYFTASPSVRCLCMIAFAKRFHWYLLSILPCVYISLSQRSSGYLPLERLRVGSRTSSIARPLLAAAATLALSEDALLLNSTSPFSPCS
ncbi:hypothetical protein POVWA2_012430 [Plasmodium ovale wallikeri]|uniref:Uncharacterized protein n=1 Tax=Plasmodium ovale wallikeri TaxID=864142 RepID=A0A1A8YLV2_PLAOA|nr:hypothetical protein POVWA1_011730 [Plasmodium ovale wallikeri]SBT32994.1 hypothetical protein POVWA2_012430 [Plasmodium ovale wallikeri]